MVVAGGAGVVRGYEADAGGGAGDSGGVKRMSTACGESDAHGTGDASTGGVHGATGASVGPKLGGANDGAGLFAA